VPANHCHHIKEDGVFCQSPALRGRRHCYFHFHGLGRNMKFTLDSELVKQIELGRTYGNR